MDSFARYAVDSVWISTVKLFVEKCKTWIGQGKVPSNKAIASANCTHLPQNECPWHLFRLESVRGVP